LEKSSVNHFYGTSIGERDNGDILYFLCQKFWFNRFFSGFIQHLVVLVFKIHGRENSFYQNTEIAPTLAYRVGGRQ
jgi:hypothetical protein